MKRSVILALQYFTYFGILGLYLPYFTLYCHHIGFSAPEIGLLSANRMLATAFFPILWGTLADRTGRRKPLYISCTLLSAAVWLLFFTTDQFLPMFLIMTAYGFFHAPLIAFIETFTMESLSHTPSAYGRIRVWGSISFITFTLLFGAASERAPGQHLIRWIAAGSLVQSMVSFTIPPSAEARSRRFCPHAVITLFSGHMRLFLLAAFLMLVSHGTYYGFFSIHLETLGFSPTFIGAAWAVASVAEMGVMIGSRHLFYHIPLHRVLTGAFFVTLVRWLILWAAPSAAGIFVSQVLHAITYGAFHMATILYMDRYAPPGLKTIGQSTLNAVTFGLGMAAGFVINGLGYETLGGRMFLVSAGVALAGAGCMLLSNRQVPNMPAP
ncbi:MAG: MFS transporter [Deltaproteobacteria bacterium]|nr:MAG: MFS transporter [Deltaproteobacteria bacterium]